MMMQNDNEFQGLFAEVFDRIHEGCEDQNIYPVLLKTYGKKILEIGSGTGRIAIPLAEAGFDVTGIEYEADMIAVMEKKKYPLEHLKVYRKDARNFDLDDQYDVILLLCNFIFFFPDVKDILAILSCCKKHLKQDGCIIIDCSIPDMDFMVKTNGTEETLTFVTQENKEIRDYFCAHYDFVNQIEKDTIRLEEWVDGKILKTAFVEENISWYFPREIRSMIREAGMNICWESSLLSPDGVTKPIDSDSCNMIFCCKSNEDHQSLQEAEK